MGTRQSHTVMLEIGGGDQQLCSLHVHHGEQAVVQGHEACLARRRRRTPCSR